MALSVALNFEDGVTRFIECRLRFNWVTLSFRYKTIDTYFGTSFYTLDTTGPKPLISNKKIILKNDYIHHVVDIYQI